MWHSLVRRALPSLIAVAAGTLCVAGTAQASYTIGQTAGATDGCGTDQVLVQKSVHALPSYQASSSGVVVSWSYRAGGANPNITFKVYHHDPAVNINTWFVRSAS